jgi:hypothetical protein
LRQDLTFTAYTLTGTLPHIWVSKNYFPPKAVI